jgi:uncharacterized protein involved in response to NO
MVFGFAAATVAGFLLTAIPNWTGRMPLQGGPLATLVLLWAIGRVGVWLSARIGAPAAAVADLCFSAAFLAVIMREILAGQELAEPADARCAVAAAGWQSAGPPRRARTRRHVQLGNRLGPITLLMLISLVGGRIIPSFTRNWLAKAGPEVSPPVSEEPFDLATLVVTGLALLTWAIAPDAAVTPWAALVAGVAVALRLSRWRSANGLRAAAADPACWL